MSVGKGLVAGNEFRAAQVLAHYIFVRGMVNASNPITFESRSNPALFFALLNFKPYPSRTILAAVQKV